MKTLSSYTLVYDDECPLCDLYTGAFVGTAMLDEQGRERYSSCSRTMDRDRARDEIALVHRETGEVIYGIDSLFKVLSFSFPLLRPLFGWHPFDWTMRKVYSLISFNRKVIAPGRIFEAPGSCTPGFNLRYRVAYIVIAWILTSLILAEYSGYLVPLISSTSYGREFLICAGQIAFQALTLSFIRRDLMVHYLGNMMTVSLIGSIALCPALMLFGAMPTVSPLAALGFLMVIVGAMLLEHVRRVQILGIDWRATLSWVIYRMIVLFILLA